mmetsp:Transcript_65422/g.191450  ORF Transcript_65422/g.191450 Transcript_65422/m.191450 type:complete len:251 (-) Transcript_65422:445-1197(-)
MAVRKTIHHVQLSIFFMCHMQLWLMPLASTGARLTAFTEGLDDGRTDDDAPALSAAPVPAPASRSAALPTTPMIASGAYLPTTSGGWIMSNSADASLPANVRMASSPPGCWDKKLVTLSTFSCRMTQQSLFVVCFATSSFVYADMPAGRLGAAAAFFALAAGTGAAAGAAPFDAEFMPSSYDPPESFELCTPPSRPPPDSSAREVSFMLSPNMYLVHALPATRPKTTQSNKELPPRRLLPCTPPATSPAA